MDNLDDLNKKIINFYGKNKIKEKDSEIKIEMASESEENMEIED